MPRVWNQVWHNLFAFMEFIIIIIHEFHRDASLEQNFRAAMCHVLNYSCNVDAAAADSLRWLMICGTDLRNCVW